MSSQADYGTGSPDLGVVRCLCPAGDPYLKWANAYKSIQSRLLSYKEILLNRNLLFNSYFLTFNEGDASPRSLECTYFWVWAGDMRCGGRGWTPPQCAHRGGPPRGPRDGTIGCRRGLRIHGEMCCDRPRPSRRGTSQPKEYMQAFSLRKQWAVLP